MGAVHDGTHLISIICLVRLEYMIAGIFDLDHGGEIFISLFSALELLEVTHVYRIARQ